MFLIISALLLGYVIRFYYLEFKIRQKSPPGPMPLPIIGNMLNLAFADEIPCIAIAKLAQKYGDIFRIKIGSKDMVVPITLETIQKLFKHDDVIGRDLSGTLLDRNMGRNLGLVFAEGPRQEKLKAWTMRTLKDYGYGKSSSMELSIKNEVEMVHKNIQTAISTNKGIMQISHAFIVPIFNVVWQMIVGHRTQQDDDLIKRLLFKSEKMIEKGVFGAGLVNAFPILRFVLPEFSGHNVQMAFYTDCHETARKLLKLSQAVLVETGRSTPDDLVEAFALKMEEEKNDSQTVFTEDNFAVMFMDLLQASSDTANSYLEATMLYATVHPDVQAKIYEEIQRCIPEAREVELSDKKTLIYTQAFLLEAHRHCKVVQNLVPRKTVKDVEFDGYIIRKDTIVMADLTTANNDPNVWENPQAFMPERFIDENGQLINQNLIISLGVGKRGCPGESLAFANYFLFFVLTIRKFMLSVVPRQKPPRTDMNVSLSSKPFPFEVKFSLRT